jgi:lysosomal-associated transmembrane protein
MENQAQTLIYMFYCVPPQRQPSYLLPFFCLQIFDFCVNLLGAVGAVSYIPQLKTMLKNNVSKCY